MVSIERRPISQDAPRLSAQSVHPLGHESLKGHRREILPPVFLAYFHVWEANGQSCRLFRDFSQEGPEILRFLIFFRRPGRRGARSISLCVDLDDG